MPEIFQNTQTDFFVLKACFGEKTSDALFSELKSSAKTLLVCDRVTYVIVIIYKKKNNLFFCCQIFVFVSIYNVE